MPGSLLLSHALLQRGFLVETVDGQIYLTNNAYVRHDLDLQLLHTLLEQAQITCNVPGRTHARCTSQHLYAHIGPDCAISDTQYTSLFQPEHCARESFRSTWRPTGQQQFYRRSTACKLPLSQLDAHIGLLVKALSAVGTYTACSCAGRPGEPLYVQFDDDINSRWATQLLAYARRDGLALPDMQIAGLLLCEREASCKSADRRLDEVRTQAIALGEYLYLKREGIRRERLKKASLFKK